MNVPTICYHCEKKFDAQEAAWCHCDGALRTLRCTSCGQCFCNAPIPYKRRFWSNAPPELSRNARRFASTRTTVSTPPVVAQETRANAPRVLIVDDDEACRSLVACFVERLGYRTQVTSDPVEALQLVQATDYRVVITDALMPKMDGRELCRRIKHMPGGAATKIILMTSLFKARHFQTEAFNRFGVDEYLVKPVDLGTLSHAMARFRAGRLPAPGMTAF